MSETIKKIAFTMPFHISEGMGGGAEVQAWLLAKELAKRGYDVAYVCTSVTGKAGQEEFVDGVLLKWVRYVRHFHWLSLPGYYRAIAGFAPDLVVERGSSFQSGAGALYCRRNKKSYAWICTDDASPGKWINVSRQKDLNRRSKLNFIKQQILLLDATLADVIRHWAMQQVTHPFTQSVWQHDQLLSVYGIQSARMITGHESPESITDADEKLQAGIVLWVANLGPRKRPEVFVAMAAQAKESNYRFVMIGGRKDPEYLQNLFREVPDNLECLGRLPFDETLQWFDKAAFFVNTSTIKGEGFPNTFIQAWLRGLPTFSLEVNPDEVVTRNQLGDVGNAEFLLDRMTGLSRDREGYTALSERVQAYAERRHSIKVMADNFLEKVDAAPQPGRASHDHSS